MGNQESGKPCAEEIGKSLDALAGEIARFTGSAEEFQTDIPGLSLWRGTAVSNPISCIYEPSICFVAQGAKAVTLGETTLLYNRSNYLLTALHIPTVFRYVQASPERPYLGLRLVLDPREVSQMIAEADLPAPRGGGDEGGMASASVTAPLAEAMLRLVSLNSSPADVAILAPLIRREIIWRVLTGSEGARLRRIAGAGGQAYQVGKVVTWLKDNFERPLRIEELAARAGMSSSTFHQHFRQMTGVSPLQFQKRLRLLEARRLMLADGLDAATAGYRVGYESPSQFSREYSRQFGAPPSRDVARITSLAAE